MIMLVLIITSIFALRLINYGRWQGKEGNLRGAVGLYITAVCSVIIPVGVVAMKIFR